MTALAKTKSQLLATEPMTPVVSVHPVVPTSGDFGRGACEHETNGARDCTCTGFQGRGGICQNTSCGHPIGMHRKDTADS